MNARVAMSCSDEFANADAIEQAARDQTVELVLGIVPCNLAQQRRPDAATDHRCRLQHRRCSMG